VKELLKRIALRVARWLATDSFFCARLYVRGPSEWHTPGV